LVLCKDLKSSINKVKVNRSQVKDGYNIMKLLVPIIIDIMMQHDTEDWGNINYPIIVDLN
jgi:hypothetical protein